MTTILIIIAVFFLVLLLTPTPTQPKTKNVDYAWYNQKGVNLIKDMEEKVLKGVQFDFDKKYLEKFNIKVNDAFCFNDVYSEILNGESKIAENHLMDLVSNITTGETEPQYVCKVKNEVNDIILKPNELLINKWKHILWKEEKTKTTSVSYGGTKLSIGRKGLRQTFGHVNLIKHNETNFDVIDNGTLYFTSERIIFVGETKTKTIQNNKIIDIDMFEDGILIRKENGKSPLICDKKWTFPSSLNDEHTWSRGRIQIPTISNYIGRVINNDVELV